MNYVYTLLATSIRILIYSLYLLKYANEFYFISYFIAFFNIRRIYNNTNEKTEIINETTIIRTKYQQIS